MSIFKSVSHQQINHLFAQLNDEWMLITAGEPKLFNTMTASWGGMGILWYKPVAFIFVRESRYTFEFIENNPYFTLSFLDHNHNNILIYCGKYSGRDKNKIKETGLKPLTTKHGNVYFEQASLVIECKKNYHHTIQQQNILNPEVLKAVYSNNDYHRMYIGEIVDCLTKEK